MFGINRILTTGLLLTFVVAQGPEPPLAETRLTVHTLVREDIFAGLVADDLNRFARGEKNIQLLLEQRPDSRPELLAWQGSATVYRAVRAHEDGRPDEFTRNYDKALALFAEASQAQPESLGINATMASESGERRGHEPDVQDLPRAGTSGGPAGGIEQRLSED